MRVLVAGAGGQLGREIRRCLEEGCSEIGPVPAEYAGAEVVYAGRGDLDIASQDSVDEAFGAGGPFDVVFNCAAATGVDACESDLLGAFAVNAYGPELLARACAASGARLVQVSTDYVFPGDEPGARVESDPTGPLGAYGASKLAGERLALRHCPRTHVVRTAWLYGYRGRNFVRTMLRLGRERGVVRVVADQVGSPTSANDLAHEVLRIALSGDYGVWHCAGRGSCSWFDLACAALDEAGVDCERVPLSTAEYPTLARRPASSALANARLAATLGDGMRPWREALREYVRRLPELGE